jgi:hypothetical protein
MTILVESRMLATWCKRTVCKQRCDHFLVFRFSSMPVDGATIFFVFGFSSMLVEEGSTTWYGDSDAMF